jgi:hypothetical protein
MSEAFGQFVARKRLEAEAALAAGLDGGNNRAAVVTLAAINRATEELVSRLGTDASLNDQQLHQFGNLIADFGDDVFAFVGQFIVADVPSGS